MNNPDVAELVKRNQETCRHEVERVGAWDCRKCGKRLYGYEEVEASFRCYYDTAYLAASKEEP